MTLGRFPKGQGTLLFPSIVVMSFIGILLILVYRMVAYVTGIVSVNRIANNLQLVDLILYIYNNTQNPEPDIQYDTGSV